MKVIRTVGVIAAIVLLSGTAMAEDIAVKIGILNDRSGIYADITGEGSVVAAKLAVEDFMAKNSGVKVEIISADHQNKPDIASNIARKWYDEDNVDMIADLPASSTALAVAQVAREKDRLVFVSGGGTSDLTGKNCSPNTVHWTYDTWALAYGTASAMVGEGLKKWYFITADYAFGHALERDTSELVKASGGEVLGASRYPFPGQDFSSYLLQAQQSGAQVIGLANAGGDFVNSVKQASEFGIVQGGQNLAGLLVFISDVHALGLQAAQGLYLTEAFYWNQNDKTRAWSERFAKEMGGSMPGSSHAGVYASVLHYLDSVKKANSKDAKAVMTQLKSAPVEDVLFGKSTVRADGRTLHDMFLYKVKTPAESTGDWDYYIVSATIPADRAFRPMDEEKCNFK